MLAVAEGGDARETAVSGVVSAGHERDCYGAGGKLEGAERDVVRAGAIQAIDYTF